MSSWRLIPLFCRSLLASLVTARALKLRKFSQATIHSSQGFLCSFLPTVPPDLLRAGNLLLSPTFLLHWQWYTLCLVQNTWWCAGAYCLQRRESVTLPPQLIKSKTKDCLEPKSLVCARASEKFRSSFTLHSSGTRARTTPLFPWTSLVKPWSNISRWCNPCLRTLAGHKLEDQS